MRFLHSCKQLRTVKAACPSVLPWSLLGCHGPCPFAACDFFCQRLCCGIWKAPTLPGFTTISPDRFDPELFCENHPLVMRRLGLLSLASRRRTQRLVSSHICPASRPHRPQTCLHMMPVLRLQHPSELASGIIMHDDWRLCGWRQSRLLLTGLFPPAHSQSPIGKMLHSFPECKKG